MTVLAVHAGYLEPGGRVALDIYFVISGFVITLLIQREQLSTGHFRFGRFYFRRFKRLTPNLALMVAVTMVLSFFLLSPFDLQQLTAQNALGTMLLVANFVILGWNPDNYHPAPGGSFPLLHTWSLSLEEQYYLIYPSILVIGYLLSRHARRIPWTKVFIGIAGVVSLWLAIEGPWALGPLAPFAKYLVGFGGALTRVWEFAFGALLSLATTKRGLRSARQAQFVACLGAVLIVAPILLVNNGAIPRISATVIPVIGSLLLIAAGTHHTPWINRALALGPVAKLGDRSYSIYLWHWPIMAFAVYLFPRVHYVLILGLILSLAPALAAYRWVEQPLRRIPTMTRPRNLALIAAVVLPPVVLAATVNIAADHYWLPRYKSGAVPIAHRGDTGSADFFSHLRGTYYPCTDKAIRDNAELWNGMARCWQSKPGPRIDVALVGDSHAEQLFPGLAEALPDKNIVYYYENALPVRSAAGMDRIIDHVASDPGIHTVIVTADWVKRGVAGGELVPTLDAFRSKGKAVFVTDDIPSYIFDAVFCKYRTTPVLPLSQCSEDRQQFDAARAHYYPALKAAVAKVPGVQLLNTAEYFCDNALCSMNRGDAVLYRDSNHLNDGGSSFLAKRMIADFPGLGTATAASGGG